MVLSKLFMRTISQNPNENQTGISLWTLEDVHKQQEKLRLLAAQEQVEGEPNENDEMDDDYDEYGDGGIPDEMLEGMDVDQ